MMVMPPVPDPQETHQSCIYKHMSVYIYVSVYFEELGGTSDGAADANVTQEDIDLVIYTYMYVYIDVLYTYMYLYTLRTWRYQ